MPLEKGRSLFECHIMFKFLPSKVAKLQKKKNAEDVLRGQRAKEQKARHPLGICARAWIINLCIICFFPFSIDILKLRNEKVTTYFFFVFESKNKKGLDCHTLGFRLRSKI